MSGRVLLLSVALLGAAALAADLLGPPVCELADLEMLSLSRCDLQKRLARLEQQVQELSKRAEPSGPLLSMAKRKNEFIRFGKRSADPAVPLALPLDARWVRVKDEADQSGMAMVKRKNEFIRFG